MCWGAGGFSYISFFPGGRGGRERERLSLLSHDCASHSGRIPCPHWGEWCSVVLGWLGWNTRVWRYIFLKATLPLCCFSLWSSDLERTWFRPRLYYLPATWLGANYLTSFGISFLLCNTGHNIDLAVMNTECVQVPAIMLKNVCVCVCESCMSVHTHFVCVCAWIVCVCLYACIVYMYTCAHVVYVCACIVYVCVCTCMHTCGYACIVCAHAICVCMLLCVYTHSMCMQAFRHVDVWMYLCICAHAICVSACIVYVCICTRVDACVVCTCVYVHVHTYACMHSVCALPSVYSHHIFPVLLFFVSKQRGGLRRDPRLQQSPRSASHDLRMSSSQGRGRLAHWSKRGVRRGDCLGSWNAAIVYLSNPQRYPLPTTVYRLTSQQSPFTLLSSKQSALFLIHQHTELQRTER